MELVFRRDVFGFDPSKMIGTHPTAVSAVRTHADALLVPTRDGPNDSVAIVGIELNPPADPELDHVHLSLELTDHPHALNDLAIQFNEPPLS